MIPLRSCAGLGVAVGVLSLIGVGAAAATPASVITLAVAPSVVPNGGWVTLSGSAPCSRVEITGSPGASGAAYVMTTATVTQGRYFLRIRLPHFVPDPSRPGLFDGLAFHAFCPDTRIPEADGGVQLTGVELAGTGVNVLYALIGALSALLVGVVCVSSTRVERRSNRSR